MGSQIYNVPIIPPELRQEEFVVQIADSLEYLEKVTDDVFKRITSRVHETQEKLKSLNERAAIAQAKVDALKGSKKAIRVFAGAKYPSENSIAMYNSIFQCENELKNIQRCSLDIESKYANVTEKTYKEKLQFYSVNVKQKKDKTHHGEGLGKLPKGINSVSSLLLYNTGENPYNKYVIMDPLSGAITKSRINIEEEREDLGDAPSTILQREETDRGNLDNYFYIPGLGNVPEIDVPVYLPDLPGVVDDEIYSGDVGESIAPSLLAVLPDLPGVEPSSDLVSNIRPTENVSFDFAVGAPSAAPPPDILPAPPPPPPPHEPLHTLQPLLDHRSNSKQVMKAVESEEDGKNAEPLRAELPSVDEGRAGLLESIRKAGGANKVKLRSAKDQRKMKQKKEKESPVSETGGTGGDLMSDLFNKLSMRRKGISGTKKEGSDAPSAMAKISAMIPPPPPDESSQSESHDSGDWD